MSRPALGLQQRPSTQKGGGTLVESTAAMASVAPSTPSVTSKSPRILACVLCQHRKIKCDRSFPCANCLKANVQCTPSTPAPARKRKRPNQDLQERLARCEELLKEYASESKSETSSTPNPASTSPQQTPKPGEEPMSNWHKNGKLIQEEGGVRFVDSYLVSTIYEELRAMRDIINGDESTPEDDTSDSLTPDTNADLLMGGETPQSPAASVDLHPEPGHVFRLWQIFLDRVNPLFKVIHVPTLQPFVVDATTRSDNSVPKNVEALLFSIYTMAAVSLSDDECQALLGFSRDAALQRFASGVRICLNQLRFLKNHDLTSLQALLLYAISLQGRYNRHAAWILNGVVVRIAQKMGLHRDGTCLGLSPFEIEMRRRLWWQIVSLDGKYAFISGLGHSLLPRVWDTQEPSNINDADLHPSATELPPDRDGPTEMVFVQIQNKLVRFIVDIPAGMDPSFLVDEETAKKLPNAPSIEKIQEYRLMFKKLALELVDIMNKRCDPSAGPIHAFTFEFKSIVMNKLNAVLEPPADCGETPKDHIFKLMVESLDHHVRHYRNALKTGFLWYMRNQFHVEIFTFVAGQLCQRPLGPLADQAWEHIEAFIPFHPELLNVHASKMHMIAGTYLVKAWKTREEHFMRQVGLPLPAPKFIVQLMEVVPQNAIKSESPPASRVDLGLPVEKLAAGAEPSFDEYLGSYLEGDWDLFSSINIGPMAPPPNTSFGANDTVMNTNGTLNSDSHMSQMPTALAGLFGLGTATEWKDDVF